MIRKRFRYFVLGISLVGITILGSATWWVQSNRDAFTTERADCAVVFGAAVWKGGRPSHALSDRTMEAIKLLENNQVDCLVFSGADAEPEVMANIAKTAGINPEIWELDSEGENTLATLKNLDPERSYILVSNDFHLGRIRMLAWKLDLKALVHAAPYLHGKYSKETYFTLREILGTIWYALRIDI